MSAALLREAAALVRKRTEGATPGPWEPSEAHGRDYTDEGWSHISVESPDGTEVAVTAYMGTDGSDSAEGDAEHIASWHPAVGLAVADLLDGHAGDIDSAFNPELYASLDLGVQRALAVARAYLGRDS